eukprot:gnl/MRDRNA2_/MRDRNA2_88998_c0_seq1.p1 gnl/MRDRNA2_/MRDRNA2_88998_c0~~gnl/MRDRNA2_/MRDRNA2_88998_c0_seq1.p1  ORF type:complete len:349 (+),score=84.28 gnl/MRDRNA2_/MRDRNA2_88998_c0_seq1:78-1124(+)
MPKSMNLCSLTGTIILNILSLVQGACDSQANERCTATPSSDIDLPPGVHLFQSSVGRSVMRSDNAMGLHMYDLEDSLHLKPVKSAESHSGDDHAFYLGICVDMLVCLVIIEGWRRFRRAIKAKKAVAPSKTPREPPGNGGKSNHLEANALVLHAAVCNGDPENCKALLKNAEADGGMKRLLRDGDKWGRTVLHLAVLRGSEPMCALLLKKGANVHALDAWDHAPLHCAAYSGSVECCRLLVEHGAEINVVDAGDRTPLHVAADLGHETVCRLLLEHGGTMSKESNMEPPAMLSALLVERMFQKYPANANDFPDLFQSSGNDGTADSDDGRQSDSLDEDIYDHDPEGHP